MSQRVPKNRANSKLSNLVEEGGRRQSYPATGSGHQGAIAPNQGSAVSKEAGGGWTAKQEQVSIKPAHYSPLRLMRDD